MMNPFDDQPQRRRACTEAAEELNRGLSPADTAALTARLGIRPPARTPDAPEEAAAPDTRLPISIWQPVEEAGRRLFRRPPPGPFGDHYADTPEWNETAAPGTTRVCLLGESVAAGYLYAPYLTPAKVLAHQLGAHGAYEVIDLARTNERLATMADTFARAMQLRPDVMVLFAGNNWNLLETPELSALSPDAGDRIAFAAALAEGDLDAVLRTALTRIAARADAAFATMGAEAKAAGVRVLVLLSPVNLAAWQSNQPPPGLDGEALPAWHATLREGLDALQAGLAPAARKAALHLMALDGGTTPTAFRLLAESFAAEGKHAQAAEAAAAETDALHYAGLCLLDAPRAGAAARRLLRRAAATHGFEVVDPAPAFAARTGHAYHGHNLFLDYCHLNADGMALAMATVAAHLTGAASSKQGPAALPATPAAVHARAYLGAAIHTAHRENALTDKHPRITHLLRRALGHDAHGVTEAILTYAQARLARVPAVMTPAQARNLKADICLSPQHGWWYDHVDAQFLQACDTVLDAAARARLTDLMQHTRGIGTAVVDLAEPYYLWEPLHRFFPEVIAPHGDTAPAFHRTPWPESSFALICDARRTLLLQLTARLPHAREPVAVPLCVNGISLAAPMVQDRWTTYTCTVPVTALRRGLNRLTLHWPTPRLAPGSLMETARARLARGWDSALHPVFGEVFHLRVRAEHQEQTPD